MLSPYQLDDKTFVEYHTDPEAGEVTLYYALDAGLGQSSRSIRLEPLRNMYEGIYTKILYAVLRRDSAGIILRQKLGDQINLADTGACDHHGAEVEGAFR